MQDKKDKFQPVMDFPNFLLIVLKLTMIKMGSSASAEFALDDKEILKGFQSALKVVPDKSDFAKIFAYNLLKSKFLLDNYVVHHSINANDITGENPWELEYYQEHSKHQKNISEERDTQIELVHLLSMFEVTFTARQRKNYLLYCLLYLFDVEKFNDTDYLLFLRRLADKYFYDVYLNQPGLNESNQPGPKAFDNALLVNGKLNLEISGEGNIDYKAVFDQIYVQGRSDIPLYVFNYMDYKLWIKYANDLRGEGAKKDSLKRKAFFEALGCSDFELEPFKLFYFSRTRKSLEHYYPRAKAVKDEELELDAHHLSLFQINCFGNFAMISSDANTSGSNWDPKTKLDHYSDGKSNPVSVASLKFKIMMQICKDNAKTMMNGKSIRADGMEWNFEDMRTHQRKMLEIIFS